jgi:anthranilate phosphoribosyltransferase
VAAAAGCKVAKHGNRAASSRSGSADVLEALGVKIDFPPESAHTLLSETNFVFFFAPRYHGATRRVAQMRRELGLRTIFNFLGPLVNPAHARRQLVGISDERLLETYAQTLSKLGVTHALVVHGHDGLDEITTTGSTHVIELIEGRITRQEICPEDYDLPRVEPQAIRGFSPQEASEKIRLVFSGEKSPYRDLVVLNAGAALYVGGKSASIASGVEEAKHVIDTGLVWETLQRIVHRSNAL